jgi:hypothetical protein
MLLNRVSHKRHFKETQTMTHYAYDTGNGPRGPLSNEQLDTSGDDLMGPPCEPAPTAQQRLNDLTEEALVESPDEKVIQPGLVRLISKQRVSDEKLEWLKPTIAGDNVSYLPADDKDLYGGHGKIIDAEGVVYDGILYEGGTVDEGWFEYDCPQTFECFSQYKDAYNSQPKDVSREPSFVDLAETCLGNMHYSLQQEKRTGHIFSHSYHRQCSPSDFIAAVDTVEQLASWLFGLHEEQTVIFAQTGHLVVNLPEELRQQIERLAYLERRSERDWIVERLTECVQDERSTATLAKEEERQRRDAAIMERLRSGSSDHGTAKDIIERLKARRTAADKDNVVAREVGEPEPRRQAE